MQIKCPANRVKGEKRQFTKGKIICHRSHEVRMRSRKGR